MLTDEELATRLGAAFREGVPELEYAGAVPRVRHRGVGIATTGALAAGAALALAPVALQHDQTRGPGTATHTSPPVVGRVRHLAVAGLHLTYATTGDQSPLAFQIGPGVAVPSDAQQADLPDVPADVWFVPDPADGDPAMYVRADGTSEIYGVVAPGWTQEQLVALLEHGSGG